MQERTRFQEADHGRAVSAIPEQERPGAAVAAAGRAATGGGDLSTARPVPLDGSVAPVVAGFLAEFFAERREAAFADDVDVDGDGGLGAGNAGGIGGEFDTEVVARLEEFTLGGGKRIRPAFAWWGWRAASGAPEGPAARAALRAAAALELLHACALAQDDVMDGSPLRRGNPALHTALADEHRQRGWSGAAARYGESVAVLAGDLALVWADDMLSDALDALDAVGARGSRGRARAPWRHMRTELITGQFLDLRAQAARTESPEAALGVDRLKTAAYSAERPLHLGAALAGGGEELVAALRGYGARVGTAFQLRDDLLGLYGDPAVTGKPVGEDLREGKRTLLLALGIERAERSGDERAAAALRDSAGDGGLSDGDAARLAELLDESGARAAVEERIGGLVAEGLTRIRTVPMPGAARRALEAMAVEAATRVR